MEILKNSFIFLFFKKLFSGEIFEILAGIFMNSSIYKFICGCMSGISRWFTGSVIYRFLSGEDKFGKEMRESVIFGFVNTIIQGIISFFSGIYDFLKKTDEDSLNRRAFEAVTERLHLSYENLLGVVFVVISIIPGDKWNNVYGLLAATVMTFLYFICLLSKNGYRSDIRGFSFSMIIFMITCFAAVITSVERGDSIRVLTFFVTSFMFMLIIAGSLTNEDKLDRFTGFVFTGVILTSIVCIIQSVSGVEFDSQLVDTASSGNISRAYSTFENPNNYAEYLILLLPFSAAFVLNREKGVKKGFFLLLLALPVLALVLTYSRSCWVSFAISAVVFILLYDYRIFPFFIVVCLAALPFLPQTVWTRISSIGSMEDTSNHYRVEIWEGALRMVKQWGLTGTGLGPAAFTKVYHSYAVPSAITAPHSHMLYLEIFLEAGIVSILSFLIWWFMLLKRGISKITGGKKVGAKRKNIIIASIAAFTSVIFVSGVEYIWFYPRVMITFFVAAGISLAAISERND